MATVLEQAWTGPVSGFIVFSLVFWGGYLLRQFKEARKEN